MTKIFIFCSWDTCSHFPKHRWSDRALLKTLPRHKGHIFFVPLQVTEDFQIREHSDLSGVEEMVAQVMNSFAEHARREDVLLFKHHPMDRGYVSYQSQINRLVTLLGLEGRVFYGYELPLPTLYPLLKGVITINSTVGLSALLHHVPTFCMGRALYDLPGLTTRGSLERFWHKQDPVCKKTFERMRQSLLHLTQLNASFYRHLDMGAMAVVKKIQQHDEQRIPVKQGKHSLNSSGLFGALSILSSFGFMADEMLAPLGML